HQVSRATTATMENAGAGLVKVRPCCDATGEGPHIGRAIAQLAMSVRPPAVRRMARRDPAGVARPRAQLCEGHAPRYRSGDVPVSERAIADLPFTAGTPTIGELCNGDATAVRAPRAHQHVRQSHRELGAGSRRQARTLS